MGKLIAVVPKIDLAEIPVAVEDFKGKPCVGLGLLLGQGPPK